MLLQSSLKRSCPHPNLMGLFPLGKKGLTFRSRHILHIVRNIVTRGSWLMYNAICVIWVKKMDIKVYHIFLCGQQPVSHLFWKCCDFSDVYLQNPINKIMNRNTAGAKKIKVKKKYIWYFILKQHYVGKWLFFFVSLRVQRSCRKYKSKVCNSCQT